MRMKLKDVYLILQDTADTLAIAGLEMKICFCVMMLPPDWTGDKTRFLKNFNTKLPAAVSVGVKWRVNKTLNWLWLVQTPGVFLSIGWKYYQTAVQVSWQINK